MTGRVAVPRRRAGGHGGGPPMLVDEPCKNFVKTGECTYGDGCRCARLLERGTFVTRCSNAGAARAVLMACSAVPSLRQRALPATVLF